MQTIAEHIDVYLKIRRRSKSTSHFDYEHIIHNYYGILFVILMSAFWNGWMITCIYYFIDECSSYAHENVKLNYTINFM